MPRIQLKLMGALAVLVLAIIATVGFLAERGLRQRELAGIEQQLEERARLVREILRGREFASSSELDVLADEASAASGVRVTLIERDGRVVGDSEVATKDIPSMQNHRERPEVVAALAGQVGRNTRTSATIRRAFRYVALPPDAVSGDLIVRTAVDLSQIEALTAALRREIGLAGALGLMGALVLSYAITRRTLKPIDELRRVVTDIADGELETRLRIDAKDELGEIAGSINRVAEQMRTRLDETAAEKTRLEAVLSSMVEGVLVLDATGHATLVNPRLQELLDVWSNPLGKTPLDLIRSDPAHKALRAAAQTSEPQIVELAVGARTLLMHAIAVPPVGRAGCVAVFHDVTQLRQLDQVRRDFLANASHELRTPLTSIQGFAKTLEDDDLPASDRRKFIEVVARNAERLSHLIDDILELSKIEGRREPLRPGEVDVAQVARVLVDDLRPRLDHGQLSAAIEVVAEETLPPAWADRRAVEQVLTNLLDNAVKYSEKDGRIEVRIARVEGRLEVKVADSGIGIPEDEIDRVFERFYRVDKARSRTLGGTGLGLSIVKHLVQGMGGDIQVESVLGRGTSVTLWLPSVENS